MTWLIHLFLGNRIVRFIGAALVAVAGVLTFGAVKKREGRVEAQAKAEAADARETIEAYKDREDVEKRIAVDGSAKQRLRDRWSR